MTFLLLQRFQKSQILERVPSSAKNGRNENLNRLGKVQSPQKIFSDFWKVPQDLRFEIRYSWMNWVIKKLEKFHAKFLQFYVMKMFQYQKF